MIEPAIVLPVSEAGNCAVSYRIDDDLRFVPTATTFLLISN
jgi:hypothetical protein